MATAGAGPPPVLSRESSLGYRPALDGIRAVAVLAVIAYHLGYRWAQGGFLGVDVFFVLSGYLITSLLLSEYVRTGSIDLVAFWVRRARRLLPALFVMLVAVALWVGANAAPFELLIRREDLLWTLFYGANWHFIASGQDYFAQFASASPVRHTWSLAIEEQFYICWPVLVGAALWLGRRRSRLVAGLAFAGVALSAIAMALLYDPGDPSRAMSSWTRASVPTAGRIWRQRPESRAHLRGRDRLVLPARAAGSARGVSSSRTLRKTLRGGGGGGRAGRWGNRTLADKRGGPRGDRGSDRRLPGLQYLCPA